MICRFCVMDDSDPDIQYDEAGECVHCRTWKALAEKVIRPSEELGPIVEEIRRIGTRYNCVLGISGGVDSSYTAFYAHELGLRPLLVHLDNGFDTPEAQFNIATIRERTGWEMLTVYADDEYYDIQKAYLRSGVVNLEAVTDHAISALVYLVAKKNKLKYVLTGQNWATEGILPTSWGHSGRDLKNIRAIHQAHGTMKMERFIRMSLFERLLFEKISARIISPLNYIEYNRERAKEILSAEWGLLDYGGKHGENALTRFYQNYILPVRWGIDKRRAHLSSLICSGQATRDEALKILEDAPHFCLEYTKLQEDTALFLEKMETTPEDLLYFMATTPHAYAKDYPNDERVIDLLRSIRERARKYISI